MIGNKVISALQSLYGENISIAFCPYKYSMFDCMESVYLAILRKNVYRNI